MHRCACQAWPCRVVPAVPGYACCAWLCQLCMDLHGLAWRAWTCKAVSGRACWACPSAGWHGLGASERRQWGELLGTDCWAKSSMRWHVTSWQPCWTSDPRHERRTHARGTANPHTSTNSQHDRTQPPTKNAPTHAANSGARQTDHNNQTTQSEHGQSGQLELN